MCIVLFVSVALQWYVCVCVCECVFVVVHCLAAEFHPSEEPVEVEEPSLDEVEHPLLDTW